MAATFLSMGLDTFKVSLDDVFQANRRKVADRFKNVNMAGIIYLEGGPSPTRFDTDHEPVFRQESYFWYLMGVKEPDCAMSLEVSSGRTTLFIPNLPSNYATFMGRIKTKEEWKDLYQVDHVEFTEDAENYLEDLLNSMDNGSKSSLYLLEGTNSDSDLLYAAPTFNSSVLLDRSDKSTLFPILAECRVIKSKAEQYLLRHVAELTSFGHVHTMCNTKPGMMEYQCESLFRHYCYYNYGCRLVGYTSICGCGPNAAVLHYGHAGEPNQRQIEDGDICLFDMGAEYYNYGSDVTCSFPANGKFSQKQRDIYEGVLNAQRAVYRLMRAEVSWVDCHMEAEFAIVSQLVKIGIVVLPDDVTVEELVTERLGAVFMPHGLGHFIGIDTHDVGGYLDGHPERIPEPGLKSLRTARVLKENMVITVEPGCYFIDHLIDEALNGHLGQYLNREVLDTYRGFGGVRIEDVVTVTFDGFENYTLCPRTMNEIESVMAGGKWPPLTDEAPELGRKRLLDPKPLPPPPSA